MFFLDLHQLSGLVDDEGRPLDERVTKLTAERGVPFEMRACPYAGSRQRNVNPMNVSALAQMMRHWDEVMERMEGIRRALNVPAAPTVTDLLQLCGVAAFAPVELARSGVGVIPAPVAALHKVVIGVQSALHAVLLLRLQEDRVGAPVTTAELTDFVEQRGLLLGDDEVCAGPPHLLAETFQALVDGAPQRRGFAPWASALATGRLGNFTQLATAVFCLQAGPLWEACGKLRAPATFARAFKTLSRASRPPLARLCFKLARETSPTQLQSMVTELKTLCRSTTSDALLLSALDALAPGDLPELRETPMPKSWRAALVNYLGLERAFLALLERVEQQAAPSVRAGPRIPEGMLLTSWLGPGPRDVWERAARITLQNTSRATWLLEPD